MSLDNIDSLIDAEKDIISHPESDLLYINRLVGSELFTLSDIDNINNALKLILGNPRLTETERNTLLKNSWKINHKFRCPSPQEFLSEKWIGNQANDLYKHCRTAFENFFSPIVNRNKLIMYCCTGWGKSTLLSLIKYYRALCTISLRNPKQYLKLSESTRLTDITISFTKATAYDLVIKPMITVLETSPMCERIKFERDMTSPENLSSGKILFCNTSKGNSMIRIGDIFFDVASDPMDLVGRNIISISMTECSFLCELMSEEKVMKLLDEMMTRVYNRFGYNNSNTSIVMDTSPNSLENQVDQWVLRHKNDKDTMFINDRKWDVQPWVTPIWAKDHSRTFYMFKGTSSLPTRIITNEELKNFDDSEVMEMPIDLYDLAKDNPSKILRDFGACPTSGSDEKLIKNMDIIEKCFVNFIPNEYAYMYASYLDAPEGLMWKYIRNKFFVYTGKGNLYRLKRNPNAERFMSFDLAEKRDMASATLLHLECNRKGEKMYVADFTLPVMCHKNDKINIDAFKYLAWDLRRYGNVNLKHISYDQFQSSSSQQFLERLGFDVERLSVDVSPEPYLSMLSYLQQGRIKMGKNLVIKNNLKSLILTTKGHHGQGTSGKLVVDHTLGEWCDLENYSWESSAMGRNGKDGTDSLCSAIMLSDMYGTISSDYLYEYDEEVSQTENSALEEMKKKIDDKFGLILED